MLIFTTNRRAIYVSSYEWRRCETLLSHCWTHRTSSRGWTPPSRISPITTQRRPAYDNDSFRYVTKGAEFEQPVGAPCYQWVEWDHAGIAYFPHSGSWQAQGGPAYVCRDQRKHVFYDIGPLKQNVSLDKNNSDFGNYYINIYSIYFDFLTCALLQSYLKKKTKTKQRQKTFAFFFFSYLSKGQDRGFCSCFDWEAVVMEHSVQMAQHGWQPVTAWSPESFFLFFYFF